MRFTMQTSDVCNRAIDTVNHLSCLCMKGIFFLRYTPKQGDKYNLWTNIFYWARWKTNSRKSNWYVQDLEKIKWGSKRILEIFSKNLCLHSVLLLAVRVMAYRKLWTRHFRLLFRRYHSAKWLYTASTAFFSTSLCAWSGCINWGVLS